jgi:hypothetical protein
MRACASYNSATFLATSVAQRQLEVGRQIWLKQLETQGFTAISPEVPGNPWKLLDVLHLLAHLLDEHFHFHGGARGLQVL